MAPLQIRNVHFWKKMAKTEPLVFLWNWMGLQDPCVRWKGIFIITFCIAWKICTLALPEKYLHWHCLKNIYIGIAWKIFTLALPKKFSATNYLGSAMKIGNREIEAHPQRFSAPSNVTLNLFLSIPVCNMQWCDPALMHAHYPFTFWVQVIH